MTAANAAACCSIFSLPMLQEARCRSDGKCPVELAGYLSAFEKAAGDGWDWNRSKRFPPRNWSGSPAECLDQTQCDHRRNATPHPRCLAVRVGFEPTEPVKVQRFSRPPDSTTLAPHHISNLTTCIHHHAKRQTLFHCVTNPVPRQI